VLLAPFGVPAAAIKMADFISC